MKIKRLCAAALAAAIMVSGLAGCGKKPGDDTGKGTETTSGADGDRTAMGRYIETEVTLPWDYDEEDGQRIKMIQRDGEILLYAASIDYEQQLLEVLCYVWNGSGWDERASGLDHAQIEDDGGERLSINSIHQTADGAEYLSYVNWAEYNDETHEIGTYMIKADVNGEITSYLKEPLTTMFSPDFVHVYDNGMILTCNSRSAVLYQADGTPKDTLAQGYSPTSQRALAAAGYLEYVTMSPEETSLLRYDIMTGDVTESIPLVKPETASAFDGLLTLDNDGTLYMANAGGIHCWKKGGSIWETLADGSLNSLSMPSLELMNFARSNNNDYLVLAYDSNEGIKIMRFYYEPEVASVPSDTLTIFGLFDNPTVRQAISQYQKENLNVRVIYQVADSGDAGATITDTIKALNTELVNKKGADILILDGLPVADYIEKGVLCDISGLIEPMIADGTLLSQAGRFSTQEKEPVYSVAARFQFPMMYGTPEGMAAMSSLKTIRDYNVTEPLFVDKNYREILRFLMNVYHEELFTEDGMISKDNLVLLLETAGKLHDKGLNPNLENSEYSTENYNEESEYGFTSFDHYNVMLGKSVVATEIIQTIYDLMNSADLIKELGAKPATANGIYFPTLLVGINESSSQKEAAQAFISLLLSEPIQRAQLSDGFPVNRSAFDEWQSFRDEYGYYYYSGVIKNDDGTRVEFEAEWPSPEQQNEIFDLQKEMVTPVVMDRVLTEMIMDEAKAYFDGTIDAAGAADAISNRAAMYLSE